MQGRILVSSKDWKMLTVVSVFLVPSPSAIYLLEVCMCPVSLVIWEAQSSQEVRECVVIIGRAQDLVTVIGVELGSGDIAEGSG